MNFSLIPILLRSKNISLVSLPVFLCSLKFRYVRLFLPFAFLLCVSLIKFLFIKFAYPPPIIVSFNLLVGAGKRAPASGSERYLKIVCFWNMQLNMKLPTYTRLYFFGKYETGIVKRKRDFGIGNAKLRHKRNHALTFGFFLW